ncbi:nucleotidyltransferase family protein [Microbacterium sp. ASV81]|uniref:NTP transferase domain-containing protein n=1 Tax=Microbacterium capsulatum TaxID=3041921 RepID=A0ABU0XMI0_9MICO|nr:NTP transferase domain-containing protein [Microbacterium sp. ASV81]MDQ4215295.1 NTP transferase domain-containing protein [Microbacterium sp. ASV81]
MNARHAIVLAAGRGSRLGRGPKALLPWGDEVLATRAARAALGAGCSVTVAVGPGARIARRRLRERCPAAHVVAVHDAALGMSASLRAAVLPLIATGVSPEAVIVLLVDQPGVGSAVIRELFRAHVPGRVTRAVWAGVPGNPILFDTGHLLSAAARAEGDAGARAWIRMHPDLVDDVECGNLGRGDDIDTPEDLLAWNDPDTSRAPSCGTALHPLP